MPEQSEATRRDLRCFWDGPDDAGRKGAEGVKPASASKVLCASVAEQAPHTANSALDGIKRKPTLGFDASNAGSTLFRATDKATTASVDVVVSE